MKAEETAEGAGADASVEAAAQTDADMQDTGDYQREKRKAYHYDWRGALPFPFMKKKRQNIA